MFCCCCKRDVDIVEPDLTVVQYVPFQDIQDRNVYYDAVALQKKFIGRKGISKKN
jgi:hypothetical protein